MESSADNDHHIVDYDENDLNLHGNQVSEHIYPGEENNTNLADQPLSEPRNNAALSNVILPNVLFIARFKWGETTEASIREFFEPYGTITAVDLKQKVAFITFEKDEDAANAKTTLHYTPGLGSDSLIVDFKKDEPPRYDRNRTRDQNSNRRKNDNARDNNRDTRDGDTNRGSRADRNRDDRDRKSSSHHHSGGVPEVRYQDNSNNNNDRGGRGYDNVDYGAPRRDQPPSRDAYNSRPVAADPYDSRAPPSYAHHSYPVDDGRYGPPPPVAARRSPPPPAYYSHRGGNSRDRSPPPADWRYAPPPGPGPFSGPPRGDYHHRDSYGPPPQVVDRYQGAPPPVQQVMYNDRNAGPSRYGPAPVEPPHEPQYGSSRYGTSGSGYRTDYRESSRDDHYRGPPPPQQHSGHKRPYDATLASFPPASAAYGPVGGALPPAPLPLAAAVAGGGSQQQPRRMFASQSYNSAEAAANAVSRNPPLSSHVYDNDMNDRGGGGNDYYHRPPPAAAHQWEDDDRDDRGYHHRGPPPQQRDNYRGPTNRGDAYYPPHYQALIPVGSASAPAAVPPVAHYNNAPQPAVGYEQQQPVVAYDQQPPQQQHGGRGGGRGGGGRGNKGRGRGRHQNQQQYQQQAGMDVNNNDGSGGMMMAPAQYDANTQPQQYDAAPPMPPPGNNGGGGGGKKPRHQ
jgi:hypothetical protein